MDSIKNKLESLSHDERALLLYKLGQLSRNGAARDTSTQSKRLVAYIKSDEPLMVADLNVHLKSSLPGYMIPSSFVNIDDFPRLPNGKIDKTKLSKTARPNTADKAQEAKAPENSIQTQLVKIWQEVLHIESIGIHDNFFEIGGDSISSIQIIAKARYAGLDLQPNQLFSHQTIAELSLFVKFEEKENESQTERVEGETPLVPIQHWFFENHVAAPHYWNHVIKVSNIQNTAKDDWQYVINQLVCYHDALRLSFRKHTNEWHASVLPDDLVTTFLDFDLSETLNIEDQNNRIDEHLRTNQDGRELEQGSLFQGLYFDCGEIQENKLFLVAHHLAIDVVSWNIIFSDLSLGMTQRKLGESIRFNKKTASIKSWAEHLLDYSKSPELLKEVEFWESQQILPQKLPTDFVLNSDVFEERTIVEKKISIDYPDLMNNLELANSAYNTRTEDLLIAALSITIGKWSNHNFLYLGLERHGRSLRDASIDISNTIGWFTSFFPLQLQYENECGLANRIKSTKEQLRAIPNDGMGYGILKYLLPDTLKKTNKSSDPPIVFNYMGLQNSQFENTDINFEYALNGALHPKSERTYLLEINSYISQGELILNWEYTTDAFDPKTIIELSDLFRLQFKEIIDHCIHTDKEGYTPSDFPEADISQEDLDNLLSGL